MRVSQLNAVPMAMATTLGLLLLMHSLINTEFEMPAPPTTTGLVNIIMPETVIEDRLPQAPVRPEDPIQQPPSVPEPARVETQGDPFSINIAPPTTTEPHTLGSLRDGHFMPIIQAAPQYPHSALNRGIEGFVTVSFTVTTTGRTRDIVVIEGVTTDGRPTSVFNRAAIAAAEQFRYQPKVENGIPTEVYNVQNRFVFEIGN